MAAWLLPDFQVCRCNERDTLLETLCAERLKHVQEPVRTEEADKGAYKMLKYNADLVVCCIAQCHRGKAGDC